MAGRPKGGFREAKVLKALTPQSCKKTARQLVFFAG